LSISAGADAPLAATGHVFESLVGVASRKDWNELLDPGWFEEGAQDFFADGFDSLVLEATVALALKRIDSPPWGLPPGSRFRTLPEVVRRGAEVAAMEAAWTVLAGSVTDFEALSRSARSRHIRARSLDGDLCGYGVPYCASRGLRRFGVGMNRGTWLHGW
jgi:hypothetical protein